MEHDVSRHGSHAIRYLDTTSTAVLTLHGQFLGSGQRFEYEFMTMKSSGRAMSPAPLERHHNSRAARRLRMPRQPKNRGPKSLNQHWGTRAGKTASGGAFGTRHSDWRSPDACPDLRNRRSLLLSDFFGAHLDRCRTNIDNLKNGPRMRFPA